MEFIAGGILRVCESTASEELLSLNVDWCTIWFMTTN